MTKDQIDYLSAILEEKAKMLKVKHREMVDKINNNFKGLIKKNSSSWPQLQERKRKLIKKQERIYTQALNEIDTLYCQLTGHNIPSN